MAERKLYAYQDGDTFFDSITHEVLAVYTDLVRDDWDYYGARRARDQFLKDFPSYQMEPHQA